jgi:hypothetical protein
MSPIRQDDPQGSVDIAYLARALGDIDDLLQRADREPDPDKQRALELRAGQRSCEALSRLEQHEHLWQALREQYQQRVRDWEDLGPPVVKELLQALGYTPADGGADLEDLIVLGGQVLQETAGLQASDDPVATARRVIWELRTGVCHLKDSASARLRRRRFIIATRRVLLGVLLASVVNPQIQQGLRDLGPYLVELIQRLADHAHLALTGLSAGLVILPREARNLLQADRFDIATGTGQSSLADLDPDTRHSTSLQDLVTMATAGEPYVREAENPIDPDSAEEIGQRVRQAIPPEEQRAIDELNTLVEMARHDIVRPPQRIDPTRRQGPEHSR